MLQVGFIEYIVLPLWETWSDLVFPGAVGIVKNMERNRWWYEQHLPEGDQPGGGPGIAKTSELGFDGFDEDHNFADERVYPLPGDEDDDDDDDLDDDSYEELLSSNRRLPGGIGDTDAGPEGSEAMASTQI